ncbi:MAG TPA: hypothetical protein VHI11_03675 [Jiangellaceae bacterium]|jgi:hypothetical protein|nr:hypothetical protein [Jiangellaceae bacterium]
MNMFRRVAALVVVGAFGAILTSCSGDPDDAQSAPTAEPDVTPAAATESSDPLLPDGTYQTSELTADELIATGVSAGFDPAAVEDFVRVHNGIERTAVYTIKLEAGRWTQFEELDGRPAEQGWTGTYQVINADTVTATDPCGSITYDYALQADQLTIDMVKDECQGFGGGSSEAEQIAQTVIYETAPFAKIG